MDTPGVILPEPIVKARVWGGNRLSQIGRSVPAGVVAGESWEVADLPDDIEDGRVRIMRGPGEGGTLGDLLRSDPAGLLGDVSPSPEGGYPLLVKLLDAGTDLSIQVHPTASYAAAHDGARTKSEAWLVLDADPGARILCGFASEDGEGIVPPPSAGVLREAIASGSLPGLLKSHPVAPGDCIVLPTGLCHALGGGLLVAEVQTPSDTTFRLHDWGRTDRELHVEPAIACLTAPDAPTAPAPAPDEPPHVLGPARVVPLARTDAFDMDRWESTEAGPVRATMPSGPAVLVVLEGTLHIEDPRGSLELDRGRTAIVPAALGPLDVTGPPGTRWLRAVPRSG